MSLIENPTTPVSSEPNEQGGLNLTGMPDAPNRINGSDGNDVVLGSDPGLGADVGQADVLFGGAGDDTIAGFGGDDSLVAGEGNNVMYGGQGNDTVVAGPGDDVAFGGQGNDYLVAETGNNVMSGDIGDDTIAAGAGDDVVLGGEGNDYLVATGGRNVMVGGNDNDTVAGGSSDDLLFGNSGNDYLIGGGGNNSLFGGQGDDTLVGGAGNDYLSGDRGNNLLTGGEGNDTFVFSSHGNVNITPEDIGNDTITDFVSGSDRIALDRNVYAALGDNLEVQDFEVMQVADGASEAKLIYEQSTGQLFYNPTVAPDDKVTIAKLENVPNLTLNDFELL